MKAKAGVWDGTALGSGCRTIVRRRGASGACLPYDRYVFFNFLITEAGGGLEHKDSTVLMASRWATRTRRAYIDWLQLAAHEFFHAWNVKRLRPVELGPFDYENENYTRSLWIAEGFTDYYSELLVRRAGLVPRPSTLDRLSAVIRTLQTTPGRLVQPLRWPRSMPGSSCTAPTRTRPTPPSATTPRARWSPSCSTRESAGHQRRAEPRRCDAPGLPPVRGERGFTPAEFRSVAGEVAGADLGAFFRRALETTEELDYREVLDWFGLRFAIPDTTGGAAAWLGVTTRANDGRLVVAQVLRGTPAYESGRQRRRAPRDRRLSAGTERTRCPPGPVSPGRPGDAARLPPRPAPPIAGHPGRRPQRAMDAGDTA